MEETKKEILEEEQANSSESAEISSEEAVSTEGQNTDKPAEHENVAENTEPEKGLLDILKDFVIGCKKSWKKYGFAEFLLIRFLGVYMIVTGINTWNIRFRHDITISATDAWRDFVQESSFLTIMLWTCAGFAFLTFLYTVLPEKWRKADPIVLIGGTLFFGIVMMWQDSSVYHCLGMMAISIVFVAYAFSKLSTERLEKLPNWLSATIVFGSATVVCVFVAITTVCHNLIFGTSTFDFGIFVQMYHSMVNNLSAVTTCERDMFLSHFNVHASFIYYLLVPFYKLFPSGTTLLIAQAVLSMAGVIPFYLILKNHKFKGIPLIAASFLYVFCAGIFYPCYYDFHENAFLPTILMWLCYAIDKKKMLLFYLMSIATCIVKEDAPLYVLCIAMFFFFNEKSAKRFHGVVITIVSGIYFVLITNWLTKHGDGSSMAASRFGHLTIDPSAGFAGIVKNVLTDPAYFFSLFFTEQSLTFFLQIMVPLAFLPFLTKKISRYLLMLPFIIMNLVIGYNYGYACQINYQYIFGPSCLLLYMSVLNLDDLDTEKGKSFVYCGAAASILMLTSSISGTWGYYTRYTNAKDHFDKMHACLDSVPEDASVAANTWYQPHISNRDEVYLLDGNDLIPDPNDENNKVMKEPNRYDFVVMSDNDENTIYFQPDLERNGFTEYRHEEGVWIYVNPSYQFKN